MREIRSYAVHYVEGLVKDYEQLLQTFKHRHVAGITIIDRCQKCGLDVRNSIHIQ